MKAHEIITLTSLIRNAANDFIEKELEAHGVTGVVPAHGTILKILFDNRDGIPMKELVEISGKAKSTITSNMNTLLKYGYIVKEQDPSDARSQLITLTNEGKALEQIFVNTSEKLLSRVYKDISVEDQNQVARILNNICKNIC